MKKPLMLVAVADAMAAWPRRKRATADLIGRGRLLQRHEESTGAHMSAPLFFRLHLGRGCGILRGVFQ